MNKDRQSMEQYTKLDESFLCPPVEYIDGPGFKLAYRDTGGLGPVVILLHALAGSSESWQFQFGPLVSAGFRVIAPDRRGWGESSPSYESETANTAASEDFAFLVEYLEIRSFHLVGIAGGGFVALDYACWQPKRLKSLIVAASTGMFSEKIMKDYARRIEIPGVSWPCLHLEVGLSYLGSHPKGVQQWERIYHHARRHSVEPQELRTPNTFEKLKYLDMPILIMMGGSDLLAPPGLMKAWCKELPVDYERVVLPSAGHSMNWEAPEKFNQALLDFLT